METKSPAQILMDSIAGTVEADKSRRVDAAVRTWLLLQTAKYSGNVTVIDMVSDLWARDHRNLLRAFNDNEELATAKFLDALGKAYTGEFAREVLGSKAVTN